MRRLRSFLFLVLTFILMSTVVFAQRDLGTLTGTISDAQGATVPNAKVRIVEDATGIGYDLETNATGEFVSSGS
jgi:hypothetical protein